MKRFLRTWVAGLLLAAMWAGSASAQQTRLATIDVKKVFDGYWKTKAASEQIQKRRNEMQSEYKNMIDDLKKMQEDYDTLLKGANDQNVALEERDRRKKAATDKLTAMNEQKDGIAQYEKTSGATLGEQGDRMKANILSEIRNVVTAKAKSGSFSMVIDTSALSAAGTQVILYSNNENDLTDSVLLQLNANAPTDTTKTDDLPMPDKKDDRKKDAKK